MARRITTILTSVLFGLTMLTGSALAMQPPGEPAQDHFGCPNPIAGHPGAAGLVDAAPRVGLLTGNSMPTAWNAVEYADPIKLGECS